MYLGDISFRFASKEHQIKTQKIFKSLPGIKVLIPGNHDKMLGLEYLTGCGFDYIYDSFEYNNLIFTHKPIRMDVYPDDYLNIHGHIHNDRFYKTTDGSRNVNVFPYWYNNKPVTLQYLLDNWKDLVKDNYWLNNAGYGESLLYTDTYYKQDIVNESALNNYKKIQLNKENINKYKKDYLALKHIRDNNDGYLFIDNDKLVAVVAVETKEDGSKWGTALEIFNPYKGKGLSYKLLDIATKDLGIEYLSVRKTNKLAIHIYEKYGFKSYKETDSQFFMKYNKNLKESTNMINETKRSELPDSAFGIPEDRKYPLDTEKHVRSAIKLFGHAQESKKKALAKRIQSAARKYDITIPENTQCYKYLHEGNTDILDIAENMDNYILAYIDNRVVNIPLNKITWWYIAEAKYASPVDSELYYKSLEDCAKFKAQDLNNETNHYFDDNLYCEEYVFISNLSFIPEKYNTEEHELVNIGIINVFANGEYEWVTQYPIRISDDRIISPMKESMALNTINPVIGMNRPFLINTGEKLGLVTDLETDKMLSVDGDNTLNIEPVDTSGINEFYEFIGNKAYLNKLNEDYKCNNKVDNLYTSLTGKDLYSIDQMEFDEDNFRKIDKDLMEQQTISKFVTFRDNLIESIFGSNISIVHLESVVDKSSIPTFVNKYNKLNDIVLKEDIDGVYFYSTLSKKRSGSVKDSSLLTENMLKSIL